MYANDVPLSALPPGELSTPIVELLRQSAITEVGQLVATREGVNGADVLKTLLEGSVRRFNKVNDFLLRSTEYGVGPAPEGTLLPVIQGGEASVDTTGDLTPKPGDLDGELVEEPADLVGPNHVVNSDTDKPVPASYAHLPLGTRVERIRADRAYIQKQATSGSAPFKSALSHAEVVKLLRPLGVKHGVRWYPCKCELVDTRVLETTDRDGKTKFSFSDLMKYTFCFCRTEAPACRGGDLDDSEYVEIIVRSLDNQDKGPGKASTYAEKMALVRYFNMEYGDDPDFTISQDLLTDAPADIEERILKIRKLAQETHGFSAGPDLDGYLRSVCAQLAKQYNRPKVKNEYALPVNILDQWIANLEAEAAAKGNEPAPTDDDYPG
jgi:hypothetical protein